MRNDNFFVIQGWMVNELKLSGNELMIYAIIHGFSQEENSWYEGSLSYLNSFINCKSKTTTMNILKNLLEKDLIEKQEYKINNVQFCRYRTVYQKLIYPISKIDMNNNIINNNKENNISKDILKKKVKSNPTLEEIEKYISDKKLEVNAKQFYDYFEVGGWKDSKGNKVKNWKQKLLTWNKFNSKKDNNKKKWWEEDE